MRTTLTLDEDVARLVADAAHEQRRPIKQVVNDALRLALRPAGYTEQQRYGAVPHEANLAPGLDLTGFNRLVDDLETDAVVAKAARGR